MSIIKKDVYMLDTANATKIYDTFIGPIDLNYYHSFNCYFAFSAIKNSPILIFLLAYNPLPILEDCFIYKLLIVFIWIIQILDLFCRINIFFSTTHS